MRCSSVSFLAVLAIGAALCWPAAAGADTLNCPHVPEERASPTIKLLAPPPCDSCAETKAELDELTQMQAARTPAEEEHAKGDIEISIPRFLTGAGIKFDAAALAKCGDFFERLSKVTREVATDAKNTFCRPRPYDLPGNTLKPLQQLKNSASYPSGHTTFGTFMATILAAMAPEKKQQLYARAADYGHSRMLAGVHYRSDIDGGKILGSALAADEFISDEAFKAALPSATVCVRDALGLPSGSPAVQAEAPHP